MFNRDIEKWTEDKAIHTASEIYQQPQTWLKTKEIIKDQKEAIETFVNKVINQPEYDVIFTGAGTSEFVGNSLVPLFLKQGKFNYKSIATTNLVATPSLYVQPNKPTLLVSFGRSGNSPESIAAIDVVNTVNPNALHLVITCNHDGELAKRDSNDMLAIKLPKETNDASFAMTSSFTNMMLAAYMALNIDTLDTVLPEVEVTAKKGQELLNSVWETVYNLVESFDFDRIVYLGDANLNGIAEESSLKMLELTAGEVVTMFNTPLGFRHGPKSIVNGSTLTVVYLSRDAYTRKYQIDIIKEMSPQRTDNQIMVVDVISDPSIVPLVNVYVSLDMPVSLDDDLIGMDYIIIAQLLALYKSLKQDKSPDNPWPSGVVNRVVKGVNIYPYNK